jgi:elongation factor Ts
MAISAADVKTLREMTGVGMMDCKKALTENNGDMDAAVDWLRSRGLAKAAKKADRVAAEGLVGIASEGNRAAVVEINSETDFVARNEQFQSIVKNTAKLALENGADAASLGSASYPGTGRTVSEELTEAIAKIGENMSLRRAAVVEVSEGVIGTYVHSAISEGLGRIGILVGLESTGDKAVLETLGKQIAMHVAATSPVALSSDDVDAELVERERAVFIEQAKASGKPDNIIEKMVEGRIRKFYEEVTLLAQTFVITGEGTVEQAVEAAAKDAGAPIKVTSFVRFAIGEGIEKQESDFAAEVAAAAGSA